MFTQIFKTSFGGADNLRLLPQVMIKHHCVPDGINYIMRHLLIFSILILSKTICLSQTNKQQQEKQYSIPMPIGAWQVIQEALGKLPAEKSRDIMNYIEQQIYLQNQPQKQPADTSKKVQPKINAKP